MIRFNILNYFSRNELNYIKALSDDYVKALTLISRVYRDKQDEFSYKKDIGGNPEIGHFTRVADSFRNPPQEALICHDEALIESGEIVGLLHDVVEDGLLTFNDLKIMGFSEKIINALKLLDYDKTKFNSYNEYITNILDSGNLIAIWVKYYDMFDNSSETRIKLLNEKLQSKLTKKYGKEMPRIINTLEQKIDNSVYQRKRKIV